MQIWKRRRGQPSKVSELESKREELEARDAELLAKQNEAGEEFKALRAERPTAGVVRRLEIDERMERLTKRYEQLQAERVRVANVKAGVLRDLELHGRRLRAAERVIDVMDNEPDRVAHLSPFVRRAEYERAKEVVKELT